MDSKMSANRLKYDSGFAPVPYMALRDIRLSIEARGLFALLVTHSTDWEFYRKDIIRKCGCGKAKYDKMRKQLVKCGYLEINRVRNNGGKFSGYEWIIHASPEGQVFTDAGSSRYRIPANTDSDKSSDIRINKFKNKQIQEKQLKASAQASMDSIPVNKFLNFKGLDYPEKVSLPAGLKNYIEQEFTFSTSALDDSIYLFAEFWMLCINQPHGRKTQEEWVTELKKWVSRDARKLGFRT